jgi:hypothetical protein
MKDVRVSFSTLLIVSAIVGAGAFAAGRSTGGQATSSTITMAADPRANDLHPQDPHEQGLPGAPQDDEPLPPGHPPFDPNGAMPGAGPAADTSEPSLEWKVPARWKVVPNPSTMRIATYRVPHAASDSVDAEVSVTQAGGSVEANADRWVGQFDAEGQKHAKRTTKKIAGFDVTIVEVEGTYAGGMAMGSSGGAPPEAANTALLGAIVGTPGMPYFFKMTGPARSVHDARADLDSLLASMKPAGAGKAPSASPPSSSR